MADDHAELLLDAKTGKELGAWIDEKRCTNHNPWPGDTLVAPNWSPPAPGRACYDLDGREPWSFRGMSSIAIPTPARATDCSSCPLAMLATSSVRSTPQVPVPPATFPWKPVETHAFIAWSDPVGGPYNPSPLYYEGRLYISTADLVSCGGSRAASSTTANAFRRLRLYRLPAANGRVFWPNDGVCYVLRPATGFELLHTNRLSDDDMCIIPALADDRLLIPHCHPTVRPAQFS